MTTFENPPDEAIRTLLRRVRSIAVVGLSPKRERPSHEVAAAMQRFGYRIVPVRPGVEAVLGEPAYSDLRAVGSTMDLVDVFRAPEYVESIVDACIELGVRALWLQEGVVNEPAARRACKAGITVVMDRCLYKEYLRLLASSA